MLAAVKQKKLAKCHAKSGRILAYSQSNSEGRMFRMNPNDRLRSSLLD